VARDPLTRLARLRAIEQRTATLELARRLGAEAAAAQAARDADAALVSEAAAAPTDYARWLVRALPERTRAHTRAAAAADATGAARALLAEAMQRSDVVDEALAARRAQARAHADRQAQALADELSLRPRA
jgi:hypothetical protein